MARDVGANDGGTRWPPKLSALLWSVVATVSRQLTFLCRAFPAEISAYNTLLAGFVRLGELTMARAVLDKAKREGAGPDAYTYSTFAAGLAAAGRLDEAEELLTEAEAAGVALNVYVYCAVLNGIVRQGDVPRAEQLLARARAAGVRPTVAMYNILIRGCAFGGRGAAAAADAGAAVESLMAEMRAAGLRPNAVTYGTLVQAAVRDGNIDAALGVLSAMRVDGVSPDGAVFTSLMKLFRTQGYHAQVRGRLCNCGDDKPIRLVANECQRRTGRLC